MYEWLRKLQNQPKAQRQQIAFGGAVCITGIIAMVWLVSLPERLTETNSTTAQTEDASRPLFGELFSGVREQVGNVRGAFAQLQEAETAATSTPETTASSTTATSTATSSNIVVPTVDAETARRYNARPILIATSSATSS